MTSRVIHYIYIQFPNHLAFEDGAEILTGCCFLAHLTAFSHLHGLCSVPERMVENEVGKWSWLTLSYCPSICLEGLRKSMQIPRHDCSVTWLRFEPGIRCRRSLSA